jgi:phage replication-related protein YjqB (UPF0714/DUF867 family)
MPEDRFRNFEALSKTLKRGIDYDISVDRRDSRVAIIAPHGGLIEPRTSEIAADVARDSYNLYCFKGLTDRPHHEIHVTSHLFDEPHCLTLISLCDLIVAIHGKADRDDPATIYLGGRDTELRDAILHRLREADFAAKYDGQKFAGTHEMNICNRGRLLKGAQLEIPRQLRERLYDNRSLLTRFSTAIRADIAARLPGS